MHGSALLPWPGAAFLLTGAAQSTPLSDGFVCGTIYTIQYLAEPRLLTRGAMTTAHAHAPFAVPLWRPSYASDCDVLHPQRQAAPHTFSSDSCKSLASCMLVLSSLLLSQNAPEVISEHRNKPGATCPQTSLGIYCWTTYHSLHIYLRSAPHPKTSSYTSVVYEHWIMSFKFTWNTCTVRKLKRQQSQHFLCVWDQIHVSVICNRAVTAESAMPLFASSTERTTSVSRVGNISCNLVTSSSFTCGCWGCWETAMENETREYV